MNRLALKLCTIFVDNFVHKLGIAVKYRMRSNPTHKYRGGGNAAKRRIFLEVRNGDTEFNAGKTIMTAAGTFSDLKRVVKEGEKIYAEKYKQEYEATFTDQFAAIDVHSGRAFVAQYPEDAIEKARTKHKDAVVHLVRIGAPSAYQVSFVLACADGDLARVL